MKTLLIAVLALPLIFQGAASAQSAMEQLGFDAASEEFTPAAEEMPQAEEALQAEETSRAMPEAGAQARDAARYDPVKLSQTDIMNTEKLNKASADAFEAYMSESGLFSGLEKVFARAKFKQVQAWTAPFLQSHVTGMELSMKEETVAGKNRLAVVSSMDYNGHKVEFLRFRKGNDSATAVRIDGKFEQDPQGGQKLFFTGSRENFDNFVTWFEDRLGKPGQPKEAEASREKTCTMCRKI